MPAIFKRADDEKVNWISSIPFAIVHLMPLFAIFTGVSWFDVGLCFALYYIRMFFITGAYHRYFAHRSFKMGRLTQFLMAFGGATAAQKGPLWWAGHHRHHHKFSDTEEDIHSPKRGFWWSHIGWILCDKYVPVPREQIEDFHKYPEIVWLDRYHLVAPIALGVAVQWLWGASALFVGFFLSTVLLYHGTFFVNSLAHVFGRRRYATRDTSRNSFLIALITCGEGWHNNHHHFQSTAKAGFYWWEIDMTYYVIKLMSFLGLAWDLRDAPKSLRAQNQIKDGHFDVGMFEEYWGKGFATLDQVREQVASYCAARKQALSGFLEETRKGSEDYLAAKKAQAGELCEGTRQSCQEYLAEKSEAFDDFLLELQSQTSAYCDQKSKALDRSITMLKMNAGDFYALKKSAIDEIMASMQQQLEDFIESSRQTAQDWNLVVADLEQKYIANPA